MAGPRIRTDIVEVFVFRRQPDSAPTHPTPIGHTVQFLQMHRNRGTASGTWQPVMGHIHPGETAAQAALRELAEETRYTPAYSLTGLWQLESVNTYFLARQDCIVMGPCFAAEVDPVIEPTLDHHAHDAVRWVNRGHADRLFLWPGQRAAITRITEDLLDPASPVSDLLRVELPRP